MEDSKDSQDIRHTRFRSHVLVRTLLENLLERLNVAELVEGGGGGWGGWANKFSGLLLMSQKTSSTLRNRISLVWMAGNNNCANMVPALV